MLDHVLQFKEEAKKWVIKLLYIFKNLLAHNGSGFDSYVVLNNLYEWRTVVSSIKDGSGIVSLKTFNGYVDRNKKFLICAFQVWKSSY